MALRTANTTSNLSGSVWEQHVWTSASVSNATVSTITSAGLFTSTFTAPNTTNKVTGCWVYIFTLPTNGGNIVVTLQGNSIDTACTTYASASTLIVGWNYFRFPTPYQFTTTTANWYRFKVNNSAGNSGQCRVRVSNEPAVTATMDSVSTLGSTDDAWIGGAITANVMTPITITNTGTSTVFGSGSDTIIQASYNVSLTFGLALTVANGGTLVADQTASSKMKVTGTAMSFGGGTLDLRAPSGDKTITSTYEINNSTVGNFGIHLPPNGPGDIKTDGASWDRYAIVVSGDGTTGSNLVVDRAVDWQPGDEVVFGTAGAYNAQDKKFIKTRVNSTTFTTCDTVGGAESGFTYTHVGAHCSCLSSNTIITSTSTSAGYFIFIYGNYGNSSLKNTRFEYVTHASSKGCTIGMTNGSNVPSFDYSVFYGSGGSNRNCLSYNSTNTLTVTGIVTYGTTATNIANGGINIQSAKNINFVDCMTYGDNGTTGGAHFSCNTSSANINFTNCWSYGANGNNNSNQGGFMFYSSNKITGTDCGVNGSRYVGIMLNNASSILFLSGSIGNFAANGTTDIYVVSDTYDTDILFDTCYFGSNKLSNYLNMLEGSEIKFQNINGDDSNHGWYRRVGSAASAGSGLTDTTVRTAGSLSLVLKPEDNTDGMYWETTIPANSSSQVGIFGYAYRNATFSSGTFKVELFLPGSTTADSSYTFPTTTGSWLPFNISAYYSGTVSRLAKVRFTAITATSGAYAFIDDIYDAGTANKVAGLDVWFEGKPSPVIAAIDTSSIPAQVWAYPNTNTSANTMGANQIESSEILSNTDVTQAKVDTL